MIFSRTVILLTVCLITFSFAEAQSSVDFTTDLRFGENIYPPTVPTDVIAVPVSSSQIDVSWSASYDPFGLAGYQVFRNEIQVATTSVTNFSDIGLAASTTYNYTIKAFDIDGLVSSSSPSVSTTTFGLPPPEPPGQETVLESGGSYQVALLNYFDIEVGSVVAKFDFGLNMPVTYRIQYGVADVLATGIVRTEVMRQQHTTVLTDLLSNTTYVYELYVTDRFGRESLVRSGHFTTKQEFITDSPVNVSEFSAQVIGDDVVLWWTAADQAFYTYVRVVRNPRFFPSDPLDGVVVYQGTANSFVDVGVMQGFDRQYYTIFAYNLAGQPASGMVAIAARTPTLPSIPPLVTEEEIEDVLVTPVSAMTLSDVEIIQHDKIQTLVDAVILTAEDSYIVRVSAKYIPVEARVVMVTLWQPESNYTLSYLLSFDAATGYYKAVLPPLGRSGVYDIRVELYNGIQERVFYLRGLLAVDERVGLPSSTVTENFLLLGLLYILLGGIAGALVMFGFYRFFLLFWRRREQTKEEYQKL